MTESCLICFESPRTKANSHSCDEVTTMSGRSILEIISNILLLKLTEINQAVAMTCQSCYDLVDEIDAFEHNLNRAKSKLKEKYLRKSVKALKNESSPGNLINVDRFLLKAKWKSLQDLGQFEAIRQDFEEDLKQSSLQTPVNIENVENFAIALLKAECSEMDIVGELDCFQCSVSFPTVLDWAQHAAKMHQNGIVKCGLCQLVYPNEEEAFAHVTDHDVIRNDNFCRDPLMSSQDLFKCQNCTLEFHSLLGYYLHFYSRHPKYSTSFKTCPVCHHQNMPDPSTFRRHFLIQHCQYVLQCPTCPMSFDDLDCVKRIQDHLKTHEDSEDKMEYKGEDEQCEPVEDMDEEEEESEFKAKKKYPYVSKLLARSFRKEPLSNMEYFKANFDMSLFPPQDSSKVITSFNDVPEDIKEDACKTLDLMRTMPYVIDSYQSQLEWDLVLLKCQVTSFSFGIPGETQCHACSPKSTTNFSLVQDRFKHHFEVHSKSSFACLTCDRYFNNNEMMMKHLRKYHTVKENAVATIRSGGDGYLTSSPWSNCGHCPDAGFASELALWVHNYDVHKRSPQIKNSLQCPVCGKSSANAMDFKRHILVLHGGFTHSCVICSKRYSSRDSIASHLRIHANDEKKKKVAQKGKKIEPQTCVECGWMSKSKLLHDRHMLATHGIQVAQVCHVCQETLPDPKALVEHKRSVHSNDICYICAKSFLNLGDLNMHISRMHPEMANLGQELGNAKHKPIKVLTNRKEKTMCEICSKMVLTHNIKLHMKNHQDKQISCPKCPRMFRWNSSLTSHLRSAHGDQVKTVSIACEFCGKQFKDKSNLRQHRYSHTGGPHSCKSCGRGFGRKDLLNSHMTKCSPT